VTVQGRQSHGKYLQAQSQGELVVENLENLRRGRGDFRSDAVAGEDYDMHCLSVGVRGGVREQARSYGGVSFFFRWGIRPPSATISIR